MDAAPPHQRTASERTELLTTLQVVADLVEMIEPEKVAGFSVLGDSVRIQPSDLGEGAGIAALLGLQSAYDVHTTLPEFTDWSGQVRGLEVHVRGALRRRAA
jgi:hypothetical protein